MPAESSVLELRQTRDFTPEEIAALNTHLNALLWSAPIRWRFKLLRYLYFGLLWIFAAACGLSIEKIDDVAPYIALTMFWAGLGAVACASIRRQMSRHYHQKFNERPAFANGDRYRLDEVEMHHLRPGISFICPLLGVKRIVNDGRYLVALLPDNHSLQLVKAAFADQDVDTFIAELERRCKLAPGSNANA
jgi:hypothetical protein